MADRALRLVPTEERLRGVGVRCERCTTQRQAQPAESLEDLRNLLRESGWVCSAAADADVCPECRAKPV